MIKTTIIITTTTTTIIATATAQEYISIIVTPLNSTGDTKPYATYEYIWNMTTEADCTGVQLTKYGNITLNKNGMETQQ